MVVVAVGKLVVLPQEWQVEGVLREGQTGQVEEVEHHIQNLINKRQSIKSVTCYEAKSTWTFHLASE